MIFVPHIIRCADNISIPVDISSASADDIVATYGSPSWQTDWDSPYLSNPDVSKYAMKAPNGELIALAAYQISGRKAYVYFFMLRAHLIATRRLLEKSNANTAASALYCLHSA